MVAASVKRLTSPRWDVTIRGGFTKTGREFVELPVGAVDQEQRFLAGGDVPQQWIDVVEAAADLDDEHR